MPYLLSFSRCLPLQIDLADAWTNLGFLQASESTTQALHSANQAVKLYGELPEPLTLNMRTKQA